MKICLVTPRSGGAPTGNLVTASRWASILRRLGHRVAVRGRWAGEPCD